ncbi:protein phosphatase 2C domain-containing protein [Oscillatoria acuminata]|uniref:Uncharacterized protein n=1 Tax=Oscillatoria acuminata PCC 6304 TaxID=56110 RepID=K9TR47_9CYAN|nr:protein phosphatase 2C domain-containing protein [Oscillatoria acuminata]AFY84646.1 hypothetical protein Oscil6304_5145 [Oscillatoria acuminata PCC 6304]
MKDRIFYFSIPKVGERESDIQDAFSASPDGRLTAISDGASSSLFPKEWADLLVKNFCSSSHFADSRGTSWQDWLKPLQQEWREFYLNQHSRLPWYAKGSENKTCASATFIGLKIDPPTQAGEKTWSVIAIGDSCLFQIDRNLENLSSFPLKCSDEFKSVTRAFNSLPESSYHPPTFHSGLYTDGDIFLLATDALSQWILTSYEQQDQRWKNLLSLQNKDEFYKFINQLRSDKQIHNDDTSLAIIKVNTIKQSSGHPPFQCQKGIIAKKTGIPLTPPNTIKTDNQQTLSGASQSNISRANPHHNRSNPQNYPLSSAIASSNRSSSSPNSDATTILYPEASSSSMLDANEQESSLSNSKILRKNDKSNRDREKRINILLLLLLISLTLNLFFLGGVIYFLINPINTPETQSNDQPLLTPETRSVKTVWIYSPVEYINPNRQSIIIPPNKKLSIYYSPENHLADSDYLEPGEYFYSETMFFTQNAAPSQAIASPNRNQPKYRWLKIKIP